MISVLCFAIFVSTVYSLANGLSNSRLTAPAGCNWTTWDGKPTLLIGHRGEKVLVPEHTVESYELAAIVGADYIEPDLVLSSDGELVCFHDLTLKSGTDVSSHPEFAHKMKGWSGWLQNRFVNITTDWFIEDFTVEELQTLRVIQAKIGIRPQFKHMYRIPTFKQYLNDVQKMSFKMNKSIGIIPELKHPRFHNARFGHRYMETKLLSTLKEYGYPLNTRDNPSCKYIDEDGVEHAIICGDVIIQSMDESCLQYLSQQTNRDLMILVYDSPPLLTMAGLSRLSSFVQYYGVWKEYLYSTTEEVLRDLRSKYNFKKVFAEGGFISPKQFTSTVHRLGMKMAIYTIYDSREPSMRGCARKCEPEDIKEEMYYYFNLGVDAMFVENIMEAREFRIMFDMTINCNRMTRGPQCCLGE